MPESRRPADWQLPPGVSPGLWDYLHNEELPCGYPAYLADSPLPEIDTRFVAEYLQRPGRVLDLGCGTGRSLIPLAQRGFETVGVDLSAAMLGMAAENARNASVVLQLIRANLVELDGLKSQSFDYCLCLFGTLGLISGAEHRQRVLQHAHRLLRPGGLFLLHVHNRWWEIWNPLGRRRLLRDLLTWCWPGHSAGDRILPPHQGVTNLYMHLFTRAELLRALTAAGFQIVECRPLSLRADGKLQSRWWLGRLRTFGYLVAARK